VGHALEAASGYALDHGQAVAVGMVAEARLATGITGFPEQDLTRLRALLEGAGLPVKLPDGITRDQILAAAGADKKNRQGQVRCALPVRIGEMMAGPDPTVRVSPDDLEAALPAD
jgi:3-dehydroquinate synthetase